MSGRIQMVGGGSSGTSDRGFVRELVTKSYSLGRRQSLRPSWPLPKATRTVLGGGGTARHTKSKLRPIRRQYAYLDYMADQNKAGSAKTLTGRRGLRHNSLELGARMTNPRSVYGDISVGKAMSDREAKQVAGKYGVKGPLPKGLSREDRMRAYEGRYIAAGGRKGEKWNRRVQHSEVGRNLGLAGATAGSVGMLAGRTKAGRAAISRIPKLRRTDPTKVRRHSENFALGAAVGGGASELYGEHARSRRASYRNSPAGVARSALTRMQAYTPGETS